MMKYLHAVAFVALITGPAFAQSKPVPRYGEIDTPKSAAEIESERAAEAAYRRSLGNVPNKSGTNDPWGGVRAEPTKPVTKSAPAKPIKSQAIAN